MPWPAPQHAATQAPAPKASTPQASTPAPQPKASTPAPQPQASTPEPQAPTPEPTQPQAPAPEPQTPAPAPKQPDPDICCHCSQGFTFTNPDGTHIGEVMPHECTDCGGGVHYECSFDKGGCTNDRATSDILSYCGTHRYPGSSIGHDSTQSDLSGYKEQAVAYVGSVVGARVQAAARMEVASSLAADSSQPQPQLQALPPPQEPPTHWLPQVFRRSRSRSHMRFP